MKIVSFLLGKAKRGQLVQFLLRKYFTAEPFSVMDHTWGFPSMRSGQKIKKAGLTSTDYFS